MSLSLLPESEDVFDSLQQVEPLTVVEVTDLHHQPLHVTFCAQGKLWSDAVGTIIYYPCSVKRELNACA
ncbi:hypothetical protein DPMN_153587 [Dreissena polymorpha]|uniref:Uncharacterized protein n=1 Tax=Dreissena polymorpha TaxID=45954 RepID=A0A9D4FML8_DREPO|nr:hypothetical protein DPMN_153587 [Dreissena polymorpha]